MGKVVIFNCFNKKVFSMKNKLLLVVGLVGYGSVAQAVPVGLFTVSDYVFKQKNLNPHVILGPLIGCATIQVVKQSANPMQLACVALLSAAAVEVGARRAGIQATSKAPYMPVVMAVATAGVCQERGWSLPTTSVCALVAYGASFVALKKPKKTATP